MSESVPDLSGNTDTVFETDLSLPGARRGKVRDIYDLDPDRVIMVATDRISAFDVVMPTPIPGKGRLLTEIATWWLRWIESQGLCQTHLLSTDPHDLPDHAFGGSTQPEHLQGRLTIGKRARVIPIEFVVRGYLEGSGWKDYQATGAVSGIQLPNGLVQCQQLPEPIFTPATKALQGMHDENISFQAAAQAVDPALMDQLRELSLQIYDRAASHARDRGIIIADTKFEFGLISDDSSPILIDEAFTPDSSRFWPADTYEPGHAQPSFDKQFVREHLQTLVDRGEWDKTSPGPTLPTEVIEGTLSRYREVVRRLTA